MQQLLLPFISILVHTKTPSIYPPRNSFPKKRNRTSSSLPEVYLIFQPIRFALPSASLRRRWALTPPFHPFLCWGTRQVLAISKGGLFSVALAVPWPSPVKALPVRKYGALCCPDFPPWINRAARRLAPCKVREFWGIGLKSQMQSEDSPKFYSTTKNLLTSTLLAIRTLDDFFS